MHSRSNADVRLVTADLARCTGLSQLAQYGSKDTAASDSSARSTHLEAPSVSTHDHSPAAGSAQPEQQGYKPTMRILGRRRTGLTKIDVQAPQTEAAEQEPVSYGPALAPEGYHDGDEHVDSASLNAALDGTATQTADQAENGPKKAPIAADAHSADGASTQADGAPAATVPAQAAAVAVALEPPEPVAPGMEPEGPMPSSEMQLIITKLAGFIQVGFHTASATPCALPSHLSLACACGA